MGSHSWTSTYWSKSGRRWRALPGPRGRWAAATSPVSPWRVSVSSSAGTWRRWWQCGRRRSQTWVHILHRHSIFHTNLLRNVFGAKLLIWTKVGNWYTVMKANIIWNEHLNSLPCFSKTRWVTLSARKALTRRSVLGRLPTSVSTVSAHSDLSWAMRLNLGSGSKLL